MNFNDKELLSIRKDKLIEDLILLANSKGYSGVTPIELSHGSHLIVHLSPYPVVVRVSMNIEEHGESIYQRVKREVCVASHLQAAGVPVLAPIDDSDPFMLGESWLTLWPYVTPVERPSLNPSEAVHYVEQLSLGMMDFPHELPVFGVWDRVCQSSNRLRSHSDPRIQALIKRFKVIDQQMRLQVNELVPSHGDAHARNLMPSPKGWLWTDFEDVCLMPKYWDLASFVGNLALFGGKEEPLFQYIVNHLADKERRAFGFALQARTLMSTLGNLDYAFAQRGDLPFALKQLELAEKFIEELSCLMGGQ